MTEQLEEWLEANFNAWTPPSSPDERLLSACPFCARSNKCYVNVESGKFNCFRCGESGTWVYLVATVEGVSLARAREMFFMAAMKARPMPKPEALRASTAAMAKAYKALTSEQTADGLELCVTPLPDEFEPCWDGSRLRPLKYLAQRGVTGRQMRDFNIGICRSGHYANRAIVPVETCGDAAFIARDLTGRAAKKYLNASGAKNARLLFNYDNVPVRSPELVIVEGVFDALRILRAGIQAVAFQGTQLSAIHRARLAKLRPDRLVLMLDPDAEDKGARIATSAMTLADGRAVVAVPPDGLDPDQLDDAALRKIVSDADVPAANIARRLKIRATKLSERSAAMRGS